jgi:hypothetical protein
MQPTHEVADVLRRSWHSIQDIGLNTWQLRTLSAMKKCRTSALGGHIDACDACGNVVISYNSCRNRHCPKCQGSNREAWIHARENELLPVPYFHVVFTLPEAINTAAMHHPKMVYDLLFAAAWETLQSFGNNKGVQMGMIAVLHTWGQNLCLHPHLHCIVPGGGINKQGLWQNIRTDGKFLFPVKALSKVFRAKYCDKLSKQAPNEYATLREKLWKKDWVVFAKRPFGSPNAVVEYLGRYTHKIAISNHRIKAINTQSVTFEYKDYKQQGIKKQMLLTHEEFVRRFALHILPKRFVKIRHYGILSSTSKRQKLSNLQRKLGVIVHRTEDEEKKKTLPRCPCCKSGNMITLLTFDRRGPPAEYFTGNAINNHKR